MPSRPSSPQLRLAMMGCLVGTLGLPTPCYAETDANIEDLRQLSIADLANVSVSSVSKTEMSLADAPAAIYVIRRDDVLRSGALTLPEMLRLAPNLEVFQKAPGNWVVTARGLNGNPNAQAFSNKLLVLIDGRSVYTPLFSGVYWDLPDVAPHLVDRIEVISGPGATLWGPNAVNGVINIITRPSNQTQGIAVDARAGTGRQALTAQVGSSLGDDLSLRVHARYLHEDAYLAAGGASALDQYSRIGGGFRFDWLPSDRDRVMFQGEIFDGRQGDRATPHEDTSGRSLDLRWNRRLGTSSNVQVEAHYDRITRATLPNGGSFRTDTFEIAVQHDFETGSHQIVWGAGTKVTDYTINGTPSFFFLPPSRTLLLANIFAQDTIALSPRLKLTAGVKLERDPYVGASWLPEARLAWKPTDGTLIWAGLSRAIRSPTPFDRDVEERAGIVSLSGNRNFRTEKLWAFELGTRMQPTSNLSFSVNGFYHAYDDLRSIEVVPGPGLNLVWGNRLRGHTYGLEAWADLRPTSWWTLAGGISILGRNFTFEPGASGILGTAQLGSDPGHQFKLRSSIDIGDVKFDMNFRALGKLPDPYVPGYRELDARLAWNVRPGVTLSIGGSNLLHDRHLEYPGGSFIPRRVVAGVEVRY